MSVKCTHILLEGVTCFSEFFFSFISNFNFILCMKLFTSLCRFCIVRFFGSGMKVRPLHNTFFVAKMTNASSAVCG